MGNALERLHAIAEQVRARRWALWLLLAFPPLAMMALFIVTGIRGVDFGYHWDEVDWQIRPVRDMVSSGLLIPRAAIYPTFCKWLTFSTTLPAALLALLRGRDPRGVQNAMLAVLDGKNILLTVRILYVVVSAFAILWVYAAALVLRRRWWEALIAAAGVGLTWEYAYHARWVATDSILVQFTALLLLMLALHHRTGKRGWLYAAAVAAGLCTGTKYPGVIGLVPVLIAGALSSPGRGVWRHLGQAALLCGIAFATYLITTPSTVFDPFTFVEQYKWIARQYRDGHAGHAVKGAGEHWRIVLAYFSLAYFSPYRAVALVMFVAMLAGGVVWARSDRRWAAVVISFPVVFLLFFCFKFKDVIARNYLLIGPFFALLAARGIGELVERLGRRWAQATVGAALVGAMVVQALFLVRAAESIRHFDPKVYVTSAIVYVTKHPRTRFRLSPKVLSLAGEQSLKIPKNVTQGPEAQEVVLFAEAEGPDSWNWRTNDPWLTRAVFGPLEMNFDWYSGWMGKDRVVVMTKAKALSTGVTLAK